MSVTSDIGSVFGSLGSGVGSIPNPITMGIGAGFSVLGGIMGFAGQAKERKQQEEEQRRQLEQAKAEAMGEQAQAAGDASSTDIQRTQQKQQAQQKSSGQVQPTSRAPLHTPVDKPFGYPQTQEEEVMGPELKNMFAGMQSGQGGFFSG